MLFAHVGSELCIKRWRVRNLKDGDPMVVAELALACINRNALLLEALKEGKV